MQFVLGTRRPYWSSGNESASETQVRFSLAVRAILSEGNDSEQQVSQVTCVRAYRIHSQTI